MPKAEENKLVARANRTFEESLKEAGIKGAVAVLADGVEMDVRDVPTPEATFCWPGWALVPTAHSVNALSVPFNASKDIEAELN